MTVITVFIINFFYCKIFKCTPLHAAAGDTSTCDASSTTPFCGNKASKEAAENKVALGACGKCQLTGTGGGGKVECAKDGEPGCVQDSSCGPGKSCCTSGKCAKVGAETAECA